MSDCFRLRIAYLHERRSIVELASQPRHAVTFSLRLTDRHQSAVIPLPQKILAYPEGKLFALQLLPETLPSMSYMHSFQVHPHY